MRTTALLLAGLLTCPAFAADGVKADLILRNGIVHTLNDAQPQAEAIAIAGNHIVAVGSDADVEKLVTGTTRVVDLHGATVIPGLTESHGHLMGLGESRLSVDLNGTKSWPEIIAKVAAEAKRVDNGEWIYGRGWHESKWTEPPSPVVRGFQVHDALSAATPDNPVVLERADGHAYIVNAQVMSLMHIDRDTQAPTGGEVIKDGDGNPTGVLVDNAMDLVRFPPSSDARRTQALDLALAETLQKGITRFDDAGANANDIALFK